MRVLVATAMYPTPENPAFGSFVKSQVQALERAGVEIELLVLSGRPRKLIYPKGVFQLHQRLRDRSIDLVHAHYSYVGMVARMQLQVPVVLTYHGDDLLGSINRHGKKAALSRLVVLAGQALSYLVDAVIVQSQEMASKLRRPDVNIIPHEIDFETFWPEQRERARQLLGLDLDKKYVLFAANPAETRKRFALARQVVERARAEDPSIELVVAFREPQPRLSLFMSACDALLFPSIHEGSPNVVKQAMACNLPIIATDVGDIREVIEGTRWCYICPPDVEPFTEKLFEILSRRERTDGRQRVQRFHPREVAARIIDVYERTLARGARHPFALARRSR